MQYVCKIKAFEIMTTLQDALPAAASHKKFFSQKG
jgi:hypothetical protein